ncbi:MAG: trypsin-like peptidase domain-containing protein, partial [Planctomycetes bacterium]|nr:trypsin-like peptidase domain-containing protein [Planctomycetota bacterium]
SSFAMPPQNINISKIYSLSEFAPLFSVSEEQLEFFLASKESLVIHGAVPKKDWSVRKIVYVQDDSFRHFLHKFSQFLYYLYQQRIPKPVHGFIKGRSIITNAQQHTQKKVVLNVDIEKFYDSISIDKVTGTLVSLGFQVEIANCLAELLTVNGVLATGFSTSPTLSNIACILMDSVFQKLSKKRGVTYTRYADDITFSTTKPRFPERLARMHNGRTTLGDDLSDAIENAGFRVNTEKVRLRNRRHRQEVTGITVNEFPNVRRGFVRQIRAAIHAWRKHGYEAAEREFNRRMGSDSDLVGAYVFSLARHVRGKLAYLEMVRGRDDPIVRRLLKDLHELDSNLIRAPRSPSAIDPSPLRGSFAGVPSWEKWFRRYRDSVIFLKVEMENGDSGVGTGFKIADDLLATAGHNMIHGDICALLSDDGSIPLKKVASRNIENGQDVGLLRLPSDHPVSARPLLSQARLPEVGEQIAAIGFPSHITRHPTLSINIGTVESLPLSGTGCRFLQLSFLSTGGVSGGPVIDCRGFVVGIVLGNLIKKPNSESEPIRVFGQAMPFEYLQDLRRESSFAG